MIGVVMRRLPCRPGPDIGRSTGQSAHLYRLTGPPRRPGPTARSSGAGPSSRHGASLSHSRRTHTELHRVHVLVVPRPQMPSPRAPSLRSLCGSISRRHEPTRYRPSPPRPRPTPPPGVAASAPGGRRNVPGRPRRAARLLGITADHETYTTVPRELVEERRPSCRTGTEGRLPGRPRTGSPGPRRRCPTPPAPPGALPWLACRRLRTTGRASADRAAPPLPATPSGPRDAREVQAPVLRSRGARHPHGGMGRGRSPTPPASCRCPHLCRASGRGPSSPTRRLPPDDHPRGLVVASRGGGWPALGDPLRRREPDSWG